MLRRIARSVFFLLAAQYALLGSAPLCAEAMTGTGRRLQTTEVPGPSPAGANACEHPTDPAPGQPAPHHVPACLGMAGCAPLAVAILAIAPLDASVVLCGTGFFPPLSLQSVALSQDSPPPRA